MTGSTTSKLIALGLLLAATAACSPIVAVHGNVVESDRLSAIQEGVSRKADVTDLLGSPSAIGTFDANAWYYIGQKTEKLAFFAPTITERTVVAVRFDDSGVVREIGQLDLDAGEEIGMVSRSTPTAGKDLSFIEQMMGNVGRFSGTKKQGPGR